MIGDMTLNPIRLLRRRIRLERAAADEVVHLRSLYGERAYEASLKEIERPELTSWGRKVKQAASRKLRPKASRRPGS
jgi:hypothetical protein